MLLFAVPAVAQNTENAQKALKAQNAERTQGAQSILSVNVRYGERRPAAQGR